MATPSAAAVSASSAAPPRVAFLGPLGTYSHQATTDFFGPCELVPRTRIADVFTAVSTSAAAFGVVPIENSSFGPVAETMEQLRTTQLSLRGMTALRIGHALLANKKADLNQMKRVYSHEQGLGQCREYLGRRYPGIEIIPVNSTAQAAQEAVNDLQSLAVCSLKCAEVYDLLAVDTDIQDAGATNTTRFIVLAPSDVALPSRYPASQRADPSATSEP
ncbi:prephenate dehydratase PHA2 [Rhodotorula paludigena]|uniref:prephenate dehydratase PHA2 n=1 Tax=Rhodotorula paludigena TaxID=86838 RepID=UPI0031767CA3